MKKGLELPPVLTIFTQGVLAIVFGFMGLLVAVPLLAAVIVPIKMLYVRDVVGDEVKLPVDTEGRRRRRGRKLGWGYRCLCAGPPVLYFAPMSSAAKARLQLLGAALLFSTGGAAIKAAAFTGWQIASFRSGFAALTLLLIAPATRRGWTRHTVLVGCAYAACLTLFVLANRLTTAANTIFLQSTAPLYVLILAPWLLKEPVRRQDVGFMLVVGLGLTLFFVGVDQPAVRLPTRCGAIFWRSSADSSGPSPSAGFAG